MSKQKVQYAVLCALLLEAGCATNLTPLPPEEFLQDKVLEVGRSMGMTEAYVDRGDGLFVWRFKLKAVGPSQAGFACDALFTWYIKPLGDKVGLDDPVQILPGCPPEQTMQLVAEVRPLQEDFIRRWLALVGPVTIIGPTPATHSADIEAEAWARLIKESSNGPTRRSPVK